MKRRNSRSFEKNVEDEDAKRPYDEPAKTKKRSASSIPGWNDNVYNGTPAQVVYEHTLNDDNFMINNAVELHFNIEHANFINKFCDRTNRVMLLTGIPGSGKSFVLKMLCNYLKSLVNPKKKAKDIKQTLFVTAMTGAAVSRLGDDAMTIHSFLDVVNVKNMSYSNGISSIEDIKDSGVQKMKDCAWLFIDEVSMMGPHFFRNMINAFCYSKKVDPRSGIENIISSALPEKIVLIGDFMQLKPVVQIGKDIASTLTRNLMLFDEPFFSFMSQYEPIQPSDGGKSVMVHSNSRGKKRMIDFVTFLNSFRQSSDDVAFSKLLKQVRIASMDTHTRSAIQSRIMTLDEFKKSLTPESSQDITVLCSGKKNVAECNAENLRSLSHENQTPIYRYSSFFIVSRRKIADINKSLFSGKYDDAFDHDFKEIPSPFFIDDGNDAKEEKKKKIQWKPRSALNISKRLATRLDLKCQYLGAPSLLTSTFESPSEKNNVTAIYNEINSWKSNLLKANGFKFALYTDSGLSFNPSIVSRILSSGASCFGRGFATCSLTMGSKVSFTRTINQEKGIFNGASGIVVGFMTVNEFMSFKGSKQYACGSCINDKHLYETRLIHKDKPITSFVDKESRPIMHPESDTVFDNFEATMHNEYVFGVVKSDGKQFTDNVAELFPYILVKKHTDKDGIDNYMHVLALPFISPVEYTSNSEKKSVIAKSKAISEKISKIAAASSSGGANQPSVASLQLNSAYHSLDSIYQKSDGDPSVLCGSLPLVSCDAVTIHSVQGLTISNVWIKCDSAHMEEGMFYVALSRVARLCNVAWSHDPIKLIKCNEQAKLFNDFVTSLG